MITVHAQTEMPLLPSSISYILSSRPAPPLAIPFDGTLRKQSGAAPRFHSGLPSVVYRAGHGLVPIFYLRRFQRLPRPSSLDPRLPLFSHLSFSISCILYPIFCALSPSSSIPYPISYILSSIYGAFSALPRPLTKSRAFQDGDGQEHEDKLGTLLEIFKNNLGRIK